MTTPQPVLARHTQAEVDSQPEVWQRVVDAAQSLSAILPRSGANVLGAGCGTSYYILDSYAHLRQRLGQGRTRAVIATELDDTDPYDVAILLSRSGTTSDLVRLARELSERMTTIAVTGTPGSPITEVTHRHVLLDFADERSVVQTRFATSALTLLRASAGEDVAALPAQAAAALDEPPVADPADYDHLVFLGTGWSRGLADEAALKCREAARLWTESYATLEYRHGPIACAGPRSLVWSFAPLPADVVAAITATGATLRVAAADPQAELVRVHRLAIAYARARGLECDTPEHLSRAVVVE
ncbi:SIS domain-containing protein [Streptosporangium sp. NBC_01639]|uniref:SIS domain-containing protein n=1 Tax=unclassified Streptosporangium TaxID=2632669 RepID=UPI002DD9E73C|nr:SIS domain-containing protein [Streptosporangium sp. NBC_01756]WSC84538.1 SIS domain-containing protein [Streptosporangium sp. NBC_01756]WTD56830.1 SIS domain-containing protein [Streptosporangium sp. NBC_01639]